MSIRKYSQNDSYIFSKKGNEEAYLNSLKEIESTEIDPLSLNQRSRASRYYHNNNKMPRTKAKPFVERSGDWVCLGCKNLNFAFRKKCNRCKLPKTQINDEKKNNELCSSIQNKTDSNNKYKNNLKETFNKNNIKKTKQTNPNNKAIK